MKKYFLKSCSLFLISTISFTSFSFAGSITVKNDNIPEEDVSSRGARLVFNSAGSQALYPLPLPGESFDIEVDSSKSYSQIFLTYGEESATGLSGHTSIPLSNTSYEITVGYTQSAEGCKKGYCICREKIVQ